MRARRGHAADRMTAHRRRQQAFRVGSGDIDLAGGDRLGGERPAAQLDEFGHVDAVVAEKSALMGDVEIDVVDGRRGDADVAVDPHHGQWPHAGDGQEALTDRMGCTGRLQLLVIMRQTFLERTKLVVELGQELQTQRGELGPFCLKGGRPAGMGPRLAAA